MSAGTRRRRARRGLARCRRRVNRMWLWYNC
jgi:hypothetical protein